MEINVRMNETRPPKNLPEDCNEKNEHLCPNMKEYGTDMDCERYKCGVCGRRYKLDYDDMR